RSFTGAQSCLDHATRGRCDVTYRGSFKACLEAIEDAAGLRRREKASLSSSRMALIRAQIEYEPSSVRGYPKTSRDPVYPLVECQRDPLSPVSSLARRTGLAYGPSQLQGGGGCHDGRV